MFATAIGTPIEAAVVTGAFQRALDRAGLRRVRFHDTRHSAATFPLAQGFTLEDVKHLLGHSSIVFLLAIAFTLGIRGLSGAVSEDGWRALTFWYSARASSSRPC